MDERTTRHEGYEISQRKRKRVEQVFGWMKMVGGLKKVKLRGIDKVGWLFTFTGAAYNLPIAKSDGQNMKRRFDSGALSQKETSTAALHSPAITR